MEPIQKDKVQTIIESFANCEVFLHIETTDGSYAVLRGERSISVGAFVRNVPIRFERGSIAGEGPYRVGLKLAHGWVYAEGLTDWEAGEQTQLLLAGHDHEGRLSVAFQLSATPFSHGKGEVQ
ncbi:DUF1806 family protein [Brevibacillus fluminis]|uniref:DUF1806 family protein n=1 Tax=Brevibacillus fluminis TaxID=511487 RepID=A0A3M8D9F6_9BACL|nr:YojF family protein [Brevibacillus fluminis]RNB84684.1 DUF1806 family protein [Brevibacillus fluminis]